VSDILGPPSEGVSNPPESESSRPEFGTEDYRRYAALFNDITFAPTKQFVHFGTRNILADYLWSQGWRRDVRPEDVTR